MHEVTHDGAHDARAPRAYPFSEAVALDVDPLYAKLRDEEPVPRVSCPYGEDAWLVTRHADMKTILGDPRFSRAAAAAHDESRLTPLPIHTSILGMDPPDHTRLRRLLSRVFTMRRVELLRPRVEREAHRLVDAIVADGMPGDLMEGFAVPFAGTVICDLLGVPFEDREQFRGWLDAFSATTVMTEEEIERDTELLYDYIGRLVARRRARPEDDLLSAMVKASDEEERLSEKELTELASVLLIAGHETVSSQLIDSLHVLFCHPRELAELLRRPELMPRAVEELLRYVPLISHVTFARYATEDIELSGTLVRAGESVLPAIPSANRDEAVFTDPERFDPTREHNPHLGFGYGIHRCLGAPLARLELQVAIDTLFTRLPELRRAVPEESLQWKDGMQVRSLLRLPVLW
ncbi:cytochrome P450 [Streptomyces clavuligerus]|nr:cytochrome [Streptomyces clavuligerus]AXU16398.1 cytochrome P450 [Streptomyces clavuligerus]MBY6301471.1 cytochrome P450 [Streptomyces clavuligerus]QPL66385.1 cytochrome P450 [Streptomyces clavuligerus]QPL72417.1 cytochrome P450 [Streptomyces clavuligerus]